MDTSKPLFEADSYILQVIKDSMQRFQAEIEFPVHIDLLVIEGIVWEWSGVKGYVKVCSVSMCHHHLKTRVLVPMRHQ